MGSVIGGGGKDEGSVGVGVVMRGSSLRMAGVVNDGWHSRDDATYKRRKDVFLVLRYGSSCVLEMQVVMVDRAVLLAWLRSELEWMVILPLCTLFQ